MTWNAIAVTKLQRIPCRDAHLCVPSENYLAAKWASNASEPPINLPSINT